MNPVKMSYECEQCKRLRENVYCPNFVVYHNLTPEIPKDHMHPNNAIVFCSAECLINFWKDYAGLE